MAEPLIEAVNELKWKTPSKIQREAIPVALQNRDLIAISETGSGKTAGWFFTDFIIIIYAILFNKYIICYFLSNTFSSFCTAHITVTA